MTTHLTHDDDPRALGSDEEEPELVFIDDDEYEAAHRDDYSSADELLDDEDEMDFSFEDELDEAIALDVSDEMDPAVEEADERMAALFSSLRGVADPASGVLEADDAHRPEDAGGAAALTQGPGAGPSAVAAAALTAPAVSRGEAKSEERRRRQASKLRKEMDKAARQDEKERQHAEKAQAATAERDAAAAQKEAVEAEKREAAEAQKREAADAKQRAAEAKQRAAAAKKQEAEDKKRAEAEAKVRQAEAKAEAKRSQAEAKRSQAQAKAEAKHGRAEARRQAKRRNDLVEAVQTAFVVDEEPEPAPEPALAPAPAQTRKDATAQKREGTKRSMLVVVVAVLLLVVAGVAVYALTRPKSTGTGAVTTALPAAVASTVSANTADVAYALHVGGAHPASVNGGGSVDLGTQGSNLSVTYSLAGQSFPEQIVFDGGQGFYDLGAIVRYVTPGYDWVSMALAPAGSGVPGIGVGGVLADPSALVSLLQLSASSAREIGTVEVDGAPATEYSVAFDQAAVTRLLASPGLPSFVRTASYSQLDERAYVDGSGHVSRIVAVGTYPESGQTETASATLDLSHYGTPVSVAPPPPTQVVPEQQFEANAMRLAHASTS